MKWRPSHFIAGNNVSPIKGLRNSDWPTFAHAPPATADSILPHRTPRRRLSLAPQVAGRGYVEELFVFLSRMSVERSDWHDEQLAARQPEGLAAAAFSRLSKDALVSICQSSRLIDLPLFHSPSLALSGHMTAPLEPSWGSRRCFPLLVRARAGGVIAHGRSRRTVGSWPPPH